ncbi:MAG: hypothetical protein ACYDHZ_06880 [Dehalococcoidia bacterium]
MSTSVWLIIIGALFLIAIVPIALSYSDESYKQSALTNRLTELSTQYNVLEGQLTAQTSVDSEVNKLNSDIAAERAIYGNACDSIATAQKLINLAWQYDLTITSMTVSSGTSQIQGTDYPVTIYVLNMNGWVQNFLNFTRGLDDVLPSSLATDITIQPAAAQGLPDQATITVTVYCTNQ